jgi:hypothetical protein
MAVLCMVLCVYAEEKAGRVTTYSQMDGRALACEFQTWTDLGLELSTLCAIHGLQICYHVPTGLWSRVEPFSPEEFVRLLQQACEGESKLGNLGDLTFYHWRDYQALVEALHRELNQHLDQGECERARRLATRSAHLRREFFIS